MIDRSSTIVFFGGAGVSTESGIPDFRSADGLYHQRYAYPPETILSHTFFEEHTGEFFEFYRERMLYLDAKPNAAHEKLAKLEQSGRLTSVITQNIDGLHQLAGSERVLELHGSVHRNHCQSCGKFYGVDAVTSSTGIPRCGCGGIIKPDVVLYEESLDPDLLSQAVMDISGADLLIVGGTSLGVYPAAGLIDYLMGGRLVLINRSATRYDRKADLVICEDIGKVFSQIEVPAAAPGVE